MRTGSGPVVDEQRRDERIFVSATNICACPFLHSRGSEYIVRYRCVEGRGSYTCTWVGRLAVMGSSGTGVFLRGAAATHGTPSGDSVNY